MNQLNTAEPDGPDWAGISAEQKEKLPSLMQKMTEPGICAVHGREEEALPDAIMNCEIKLSSCRARCCSPQFALTKEEVRKGYFHHNQSRPFFTAQGADGYCPQPRPRYAPLHGMVRSAAPVPEEMTAGKKDLEHQR